jgi:diketogulonate reductase-like aldo/keto reductase
MRNRDYETALKDLKKSLAKSNLEYFDLYLMHSAIGGPEVRKNVWRALVDAKAQGLVKSIGVSQPSVHRLNKEYIDTFAGVELGDEAYSRTGRRWLTAPCHQPDRSASMDEAS